MSMLAPLRRALTAFSGKNYVAVTDIPRTGVWHRLLDRAPGDWQRRIRADREDVLSFPAVFSAQGLIAQDFAKLTPRLVKWNPAAQIYELHSIDYVDDLILRPNSYQNRVQFAESWMQSKLAAGNTYALKGRDSSRRVRALYILDPFRTRPRVSMETGSVFYELQPDNLTGVKETTLVPASEIIHDRFNTLFHPLVGVAPLHPAALAATLGLEIQERATRFWRNNAQPSGALVVPGAAPDPATLKQYKELWETNYGGDNLGKIAVLAGGMDYKPLGQSAKDSQMVEQLNLTDRQVATCYRLPLYKLNGAPSGANAAQLDQEYYSNCLQTHVVSYEVAFTLGLELPAGCKVDLDESDLLRMDPITKAQVMKERVTGGWWTRNEARREDGKPPKKGGDELLVQEQYWPAAAVSDPARGVPAKSGVAPAAAHDAREAAEEDDEGETERAIEAFAKELMR